jgi:hypothetical protein
MCCVDRIASGKQFPSRDFTRISPVQRDKKLMLMLKDLPVSIPYIRKQISDYRVIGKIRSFFRTAMREKAWIQPKSSGVKEKLS